MRKMIMMATVAAVCLLMSTSAMALIGWAGGVWPLHNSNHVPTGPIDVYAQVWSDGVTTPAGQGAGITGTLYYTPEGGVEQSVAMTYNTDVGANDEYTAQVPQSALLGVSYVDVTVKFTDIDGTVEISGDQQGNPPPLRYNVTNALPNNVDVTFTLCMSGTPTAGAPCVIGSATEIGSWVTGVDMLPEGSHPDLYQVTVTFLAGGNPDFEYKYRKDACVDWEFVDNRLVSLPTDGTTSVVLPVDSFNNAPLGCDLVPPLAEDKIVCIQVCMQGVDAPPVCVTGSTPELTNWGNGAPMVHLGGDLYQACIIFPAGMTPQDVQYKFRKDGCETWEGVPNRVVTINDATPPEQTVTHSWDDGPAVCDVVPTEDASWGSLKAQYR